MNVQVEKQEKSMAVLTVEVDEATFEKAIDKVYHASKGRINVPGFRKGKAPRKMIEKLYGQTIFYDDAANDVVDDTYSEAAEQSGEDIVSLPEIEIVQKESGKPLIYKATVALRPPVKLGKYKGLKADKIDDTVTDEELDAEIERVRKLNGRSVDVTDRPVENGDTVSLDYEGFVDGVAFEGGKGENHPLTIGSGAFIPGFEEKLIGAEIEKPLDVEVTFPEEYHEKSLAGKAAVFKCVVHSIREKELPELNDEYASDISEFETFAEYKEDVKKKLSDKKREEEEKKREDALLDEVVADSEVELPDAMVDSNIELMLRDYARNLRYQGLSLEQYFQYTGQTLDGMREQMRPDTIKRLKGSLVLEAIAVEEGLKTTDEEFAEEIKKRAEEAHMEADKYEGMLSNGQKREMKENMEIDKAMKFIVAQAKEKKA
ncbi:MAG: trigger factor [Lachnospiraceae bacterium]|nr:trigger factor [Lachnospiraceae bacterium]